MRPFIVASTTAATIRRPKAGRIGAFRKNKCVRLTPSEHVLELPHGRVDVRIELDWRAALGAASELAWSVSTRTLSCPRKCLHFAPPCVVEPAVADRALCERPATHAAEGSIRARSVWVLAHSSAGFLFRRCSTCTLSPTGWSAPARSQDRRPSDGRARDRSRCEFSRLAAAAFHVCRASSNARRPANLIRAPPCPSAIATASANARPGRHSAWRALAPS